MKSYTSAHVSCDAPTARRSNPGSLREAKDERPRAIDPAAPTAGDSGSRSPDKRKTSEPMSSMPSARLDAPLSIANCLGELFLERIAMAQADGCPTCPNVEPAKSWTAIDDGYRTSHLCSDCGHAWTTDWKAGA